MKIQVNLVPNPGKDMISLDIDFFAFNLPSHPFLGHHCDFTYDSLAEIKITFVNALLECFNIIS